MDAVLQPCRKGIHKVEKLRPCRVTDYDIQALADNEVSEEEKLRIETYLRLNPAAQNRYDEIMAQKNLLKKWWEQRKP